MSGDGPGASIVRGSRKPASRSQPARAFMTARKPRTHVIELPSLEIEMLLIRLGHRVLSPSAALSRGRRALPRGGRYPGPSGAATAQLQLHRDGAGGRRRPPGAAARARARGPDPRAISAAGAVPG